MMETMNQVLAWARETHQSRDAIYEVQKVAARLGLHDDDLAAIPADMAHFEAVIAPSGYGAVSKSGDLKAARRRGNARVRALLERFHARNGAVAVGEDHRAAWNRLVDYVVEREGAALDAVFRPELSRRLYILRSRADCQPHDLVSADIARIATVAAPTQREALRRAVALMNRLIAGRDAHAPISALLPEHPLDAPAPVDRRPPVRLKALSGPFQASLEALIRATLATPKTQAADARARIDAGEDRDAVIADFNAARSRAIGNTATARNGYACAIRWLLGALAAAGDDLAGLTDVREVLNRTVLERAVAWQIARTATSSALKASNRSSTIHTYLTNLNTLAAHGLRDAGLQTDIMLLRILHGEHVRTPGADGMQEEREAFCMLLQGSEMVAGNLVNAPQRIAAHAEKLIAEAQLSKSRLAEISGLRLYAAAVMFAIQLSRPLRTMNLQLTRIAATPQATGNLRRLRGGGVDLTYARGEIKNGAAVAVALRGDDAAIMTRWLDTHRARYAGINGVGASVYLFPGDAKPESAKDALTLPHGCLSDRTIAAIWADGADVVGIRMTPQMARHAVATLILAIEPGNFAKVAAVLGDTEDTVRRHYGRDSGFSAGQTLRAALLLRHPDLFSTLKRRIAA